MEASAVDRVGHRPRLTNSMTAAAKASGSSCGRLCPACVMKRCARRPVNFGALALPSVGAATPSASPSRVMAGTVIGATPPAGAEVGILRIALGKPKAMAVAVDHDIDIVRVVVRDSRPLEAGIVEMPVRRPLLPQNPRDASPVGGETGPAALDWK